jgi:membrane protein
MSDIRHPFLKRGAERVLPIYALASRAVESWIDNRGPSMGAAIAFYTVFSLGPALFLMLAIAGMVSDSRNAEEAMLREFAGLIGPDGAAVIGKLIAGAAESRQGGLAALLGGGLLLLAATTVFVEIQQSLNVIWRAPSETGSVVRNLIKSRFTSLALIVVMGFILLVSLIVSTGLAAARGWLELWMPGVLITLTIVNALISFGVVTLLFAANYRILPDVQVSWRDAWVGAAAASLLFALGKFIIGEYIGSSDIASGLGPAATPIIVLVWVYYSAQIFLLGAELAKANFDRHAAVIAAQEAAREEAREEAQGKAVAAGSDARKPTDDAPAY